MSETNHNGQDIQLSSPLIDKQDTDIDSIEGVNLSSEDSELNKDYEAYMEAIAEYEAEVLARDNKILLFIVSLIIVAFLFGLLFRLFPVLSMRLLGLFMVGYFIYHVSIKVSAKINQQKDWFLFKKIFAIKHYKWYYIT